jgi:hypothetical protein
MPPALARLQDEGTTTKKEIEALPHYCLQQEILPAYQTALSLTYPLAKA